MLIEKYMNNSLDESNMNLNKVVWSTFLSYLSDNDPKDAREKVIKQVENVINSGLKKALKKI